MIRDGAADDTGVGFEVCTVAADCQEGSVGGLGGEMNGPSGVAADAGENVYVADFLNHRIQRFDSKGTWERAWGKDVVSSGGADSEVCTVAAACKAGEVGGLGGELNRPIAVAADFSSHVYVAEADNHRIQKFDLKGLWRRAWGKDVISGGGTGFEICTVAAGCKAGVIGGLSGEMDGPDGLGTDPVGDLYVADFFNERIQRFGDPLSLPPPDPTPFALPPPLSRFDLGKVLRNKKKGIAFLLVFFPGPGEVGWGGKGLQGFDLASAAAARKSLAVSGGWVRLKVKPAKKGKRARKVQRALKNKGKAKVKVHITYVPTGGVANTQARKVTLVRKARK